MPVSQTVVAPVAVAVVVVDVVVVALVGAGLVPKLQLGIFKAIAADMLAPTQRDNVEWGHNRAQHGDAGNSGMHRSEVDAVALARGSVEL